MNNPSTATLQELMNNATHSGRIFPTGDDAPKWLREVLDESSSSDVFSGMSDQIILSYGDVNGNPLGYKEQVNGIPWDQIPDAQKADIGRHTCKRMVMDLRCKMSKTTGSMASATI